MIVGENSRSDDLDVNPTKAKQQTNMRAASADVLVRLAPPTRLSLEGSLEFVREDECVEITPECSAPAQGRAGESQAPEGVEEPRHGARALAVPSLREQPGDSLITLAGSRSSRGPVTASS